MSETQQGSEISAAVLLADGLRAVRRRWVLVLTVTGLAFASGLVWLGSQTPVYRARATLLLDTERSAGGVLGELAALTAPPAAASEIAVLRSRSLAQAVAAADPAGRVQPWSEAPRRHLDLGTLVEDLSRHPFQSIAARVGLESAARASLRARTVSAEPGAPRELRLSFPSPGRIEVRVPGTLGLGGPVERLDFASGEPIFAHGVTFVLAVDGDPTGGRYALHRLGPEEAVARLLAGTRVIETQRNSGVLELTFSDSDPVRAAAVANALCTHYFEQNVSRGRRRASETVDFIRSQLEAQQLALEAAEHEVVRLQREHPDLIDRASSAKQLVETSSDFALRGLQLGMVERALSEAMALLSEGRYEALSRLGRELADPLSQSLVEQLAALEFERASVDRARTGDGRELIQRHAQELAARAEELAVQIDALRGLIAALESDEDAALAMLSQTPDGGVLADPFTLGLVSELARLDGELERLALQLTEANPDLERMRRGRSELRARITGNLSARLVGLERLHSDRLALVAAAEQDLEGARERARGGIDDALASLRSRTRNHLSSRLDAVRLEREELDGISAELGRRLAAMPEMERELAAPLRRLATHKELTTFLLRSLQEAEIARASAIASADFIDPAVVPDRRYAPRVGVGLVLSALVALALGLATALTLERLRTHLRGSRELEAATGLPVLGTIPHFRRPRGHSGQSFIPLRDAPEGVLAEAYRSLRANLRFVVGDLNQVRTLAITSCAPSEGKSTTNVDMAWAIAATGRRVLLIDADMRRPAVHRYLDLPLGPGLVDVLETRRDWRELVRSTEQAGLDVLPAGKLSGSPGELLSSTAAQELLDQTSAEYDMVVLDLPPALVVADVETFAHRLDALLLLYREGGLPRAAVEAAVRRLRQSGAKLVGCVLNAIRRESAAGGEYGNGYYGGYYAAEEPKGRRSWRESA